MNQKKIKALLSDADLKNSLKQFIIYFVVGGIATVVEWLVFYILNTAFEMYYMLATALAFCLSTFANWAAGRLLLFKASGSLWKELAQIYLTSIAGLLMNLLIMWVAIEQFSVPNFISKVIATGIVFMWNFIIRKIVIYKV